MPFGGHSLETMREGWLAITKELLLANQPLAAQTCLEQRYYTWLPDPDLYELILIAMCSQEDDRTMLFAFDEPPDESLRKLSEFQLLFRQFGGKRKDDEDDGWDLFEDEDEDGDEDEGEAEEEGEENIEDEEEDEEDGGNESDDDPEDHPRYNFEDLATSGHQTKIAFDNFQAALLVLKGFLKVSHTTHIWCVVDMSREHRM